MKNLIFSFTLLIFSFSYAQKQDPRIENIKNQLAMLSVENTGLSENVKTEININEISLANFLLAIAEVHKININVAPELNQINIKNNFTNVTVADLLVFLCKEYELSVDFTGNILSIKKYVPPAEKPIEKIIPIAYNPNDNTISMDVKGDKLYDVFKLIMDESGKNLVFTPEIQSVPLTFYIQNTPFDIAMDKLALANNLYSEKTKDNFYVFEGNGSSVGVTNTNNNTNNAPQRPIKRRNSNFYFKVLDAESKLLEVDFANTPIADIITDIGNELNINIFTATPLDNAGTATFRAKSITFDDLLIKVFETQSVIGITQAGVQNSNNPINQNSAVSEKFTFKKDDNIYFFGTEKQLSVRKVEIINLRFRSVEMLSDPSGNQMGGLNSGSNFNNSNSINNNFNGQFDNISNRNQSPTTTVNRTNYSSESGTKNDLLSIVPEDIKQDLNFKVDHELNSIYVNGPSTNIERFKDFINQIDKAVPVILIEVMIIEVNRSSSVETGISWGIGENPATTQGAIFPITDLTLGATTINKIIGGFDDFGSFNLGKVVPNFFATIKAMETNGDLKVRSTPKLATLNGHRATFSNGQTSYYTVTQRNIYGTDNPQTSEITNYVPIDVELGLTIKPLVSGNGDVTLDIYVVQSSFGQRIAEDAPPDINSRNFSSIIRMQDQDIAVLGGLEEQMKNNRGDGVPLLARIPIIKWLFSSRKREAKKAKLTVLIKPTVIY